MGPHCCNLHRKNLQAPSQLACPSSMSVALPPNPSHKCIGSKPFCRFPTACMFASSLHLLGSFSFPAPLMHQTSPTIQLQFCVINCPLIWGEAHQLVLAIRILATLMLADERRGWRMRRLAPSSAAMQQRSHNLTARRPSCPPSELECPAAWGWAQRPSSI
jgi:hypothetical protein